MYGSVIQPASYATGMRRSSLMPTVMTVCSVGGRHYGNRRSASGSASSGGGIGEIGRVDDADLAGRGGKVALVVGDEPVGADTHRGGEVGGIGGPEPVAAGEGRGQFRGRSVDWAKVEPSEQAGQGADLV